MHRRTVYAGSLLAAGALLDELAYAVLSRWPLHVVDRVVRGLDRLRN